MQSEVPRDGAVPGASIATQTYGDFLNPTPCLHAIVTDGCFLPDGSFVGVPGFHAEDLEEAFQYKVLKMLKKEGKINDAVIGNMLSRRHTGFHVHIGARIWPEDETALENLAKYTIRASFSQERMLYIPAEKSPDGIAKVVCRSKDGRTEQTFDAIDWLARLVFQPRVRKKRIFQVHCPQPTPRFPLRRLQKRLVLQILSPWKTRHPGRCFRKSSTETLQHHWRSQIQRHQEILRRRSRAVPGKDGRACRCGNIRQARRVCLFRLGNQRKGQRFYGRKLNRLER